jgi:hypothetical protein
MAGRWASIADSWAREIEQKHIAKMHSKDFPVRTLIQDKKAPYVPQDYEGQPGPLRRKQKDKNWVCSDVSHQ